MDIESIAETMSYDGGDKYDGVVGYSERHNYVDFDRVNIRFGEVLSEHGVAPMKVKEDAPKDDGVVRVWFREVEVSLG